MADTTAAVPAEADAGIKLFVGNLAYVVDDDALYAFFEPLNDEIISAQVILRGHRSAGYGFVSVKTQEAADKAIQDLNGKELHSRNVVVEVAKPREQKHAERKERRARKKNAGRRGDKPVVGEVTDAEASGEAAPAAVPLIARIDDPDQHRNGEVTSRRPRKKKSNKKKRARAPQADDDTAAAPVANGVTPAGDTANTSGETATTVEQNPARRKPRRRFQRRWYNRQPRRPAGEAPEGEPSKTVLFVANLAFSVDEDGLTDFFTENGISVTSARVVRSRRFGYPPRSRGYAFVDVGDEEEQQKALTALQGKTLNDREITVKIAVDSPRHKGGDRGDAAPADVEAPVAGKLPVVPVA
ncbi:hypothetical protein FRC03_006464 [Tulasnella sp. 419]|nr:hypothetical protein FRC02_004560 [Tulasnella sp. 418]KAG8960507.1 hypothetical protein FRC03_006464 [Tulasnella sp. 419]